MLLKGSLISVMGIFRGGKVPQSEREPINPKEGYEWCPHCNGEGMCHCASCGIDSVKENTRFQRHETKNQFGQVVEFENRPYTHVETVREKGICKVCIGKKQLQI